MKKTAVFLYPLFSEYELSVALSILMQGEKPVITVGINNEAVRGEAGLRCIPDMSMDEVNMEEIDSLVFPGCMDIMTLKDETTLFEFIRRVEKNVSVIASISSSPYLLAKAGVLQGVKYTVGLTEEAQEHLGVFEKENYSDELVVQDGKFITARGRGFIEFGTLLGRSLDLTFNEKWYSE